MGNDMTTARITRERCKAERACYTDEELEAFIPSEGICPAELVALIGETRAGKTLTAVDCHWALCNGVPEPKRFAKQYRLHAVWCARRALARVKSPDQSSVNAVDVAERFANGQATKEELSAAWSAARDAARYAARYATLDAASDAASAAASDAARDAASDAAREAAWEASWSAAWDAARKAAREAAREAERLVQCKDLAERLDVDFGLVNLMRCVTTLEPRKTSDRLVGKTCEAADGKPCKFCQRFVRGMSDYSVKCTNPDVPKRGSRHPILNTTRSSNFAMRSQQCLRSGFVPVSDD